MLDLKPIILTDQERETKPKWLVEALDLWNAEVGEDEGKQAK